MKTTRCREAVACAISYRAGNRSCTTLAIDRLHPRQRESSREDSMSTAKTAASLLLCTFVAAAAAVGDPLTDLRAALHRYPAAQRFSASASVEVKGDAKDDG